MSKNKAKPQKAKPKAPAKKVSVAPKKIATKACTTILPLDERLVVELTSADGDKRTAGGLYIPDTVKVSESFRQGTVRSLGRGQQNKNGQVRPLEVKIGEVVTFPAYAGTEVDWNGTKIVIIKESELLGIVHSKTKS